MKTAPSRSMFSNAPVVAAGCALLRRFILRKRSGEFWIASAYLPGRHRLQPRHGMRRTGSFLSDKRRLHQSHPGEVYPNSMPGCIFIGVKSHFVALFGLFHLCALRM